MRLRTGSLKGVLTLVLAPALAVALACSNEAADDSVGEVDTQTPVSEAGATQPAVLESLRGRIGSSTMWGSGWIDLQKPTSFKRGEKLKLRVGGTAHSVLIRLLSEGDNPNDPIGIDGGAVEVPESRILQVVLQDDHENVVQISVHGGTNPWDLYPLGGDNGPATILSVERIAP